MESMNATIRCTDCGQGIDVVSYLNNSNWQPNRIKCHACTFKEFIMQKVGKIIKDLEVLEVAEITFQVNCLTRQIQLTFKVNK
jgi:DNA-directed RNA polymerase subunit RPC12/RpoP